MSHEDKVAGMRRNLEEKTGRTVQGWIQALDELGLDDPKTARAWLKEQGVGHFQIRLVLSDRKAQA
jgi:hypothetical protein